MSHVEMVRNAYRDFSTGNVQAVLARFHPEIRWRASKGLPYFSDDGLYVGIPAVVESVFAQIPENYDGFEIAIEDLIDGGDRVVMYGQYKGTYKPTGKPFSAHVAHVWTVRDGLMVEFFQAVDTAAIIG